MSGNFLLNGSTTNNKQVQGKARLDPEFDLQIFSYMR